MNAFDIIGRCFSYFGEIIHEVITASSAPLIYSSAGITMTLIIVSRSRIKHWLNGFISKRASVQVNDTPYIKGGEMVRIHYINGGFAWCTTPNCLIPPGGAPPQKPTEGYTIRSLSSFVDIQTSNENFINVWKAKSKEPNYYQGRAIYSQRDSYGRPASTSSPNPSSHTNTWQTAHSVNDTEVVNQQS